MYFVDRDKIEQTLNMIENNIKNIKKQKSWNEPIEKLALERIAHLFIDSILDVGNALIDGFIMRDPGSYEDIIDILLDEKVVDEKDAQSLKEIVAFRKVLVQNYLEINHEELLKALTEHLPSLELYPTKVRTYLENELGPVNAFKS
ncbi:type VII toxin-antitoxin system HepT family RNase toxin [Calidifontibacillus erzurumensis]|uniref:DUF86 domain-containing protein n=1 Tax=Calidifontibacillus erzurumensis TaxID=2741433 RepID=A0A8J8GH82_9BACI|nr:DUF86 domain-containing protein [Calidifontibacillus erzurumensis]NSL51736.1 DUF86 domain-containing protein [Calidifontibacillus erzurumensis]